MNYTIIVDLSSEKSSVSRPDVTRTQFKKSFENLPYSAIKILKKSETTKPEDNDRGDPASQQLSVPTLSTPV